MSDKKILNVVFFRQESEREPVRDWLTGLSRDDRKTIGYHIKLVEEGWPIGMPLVRKMQKGLREVRVDVSDRRIARVFFTVKDDRMVLLHGFIKKSLKTPQKEIDLANKRMKGLS